MSGSGAIPDPSHAIFVRDLTVGRLSRPRPRRVGPPGRVDREVADDQRSCRPILMQAHQGVEACGELGDGKGLHDVVVGSRGQPRDAVLHLVAGREDADGQPPTLLTQTVRDAEAGR
jgi:hypothetical protein